MTLCFSGDPSCDVHILFDGDRTRLGDPTVAMEARWREAGGDFKVWFDPQTGQMTGVEVISTEVQDALRAVMESERPGGVNSQGGDYFY